MGERESGEEAEGNGGREEDPKEAAAAVEIFRPRNHTWTLAFGYFEKIPCIPSCVANTRQCFHDMDNADLLIPPPV